MDYQASLAQNREMLAQFRSAAAGQDGDEIFLRIETLLTAKGLAIE